MAPPRAVAVSGRGGRGRGGRRGQEAIPHRAVGPAAMVVEGTKVGQGGAPGGGSGLMSRVLIDSTKSDGIKPTP